MNGVPLRRVNQAYVIATKTKVDISSLDVPAKLDDSYFRRSRVRAKAGSSGIFAESKQVRLYCMGVCRCVFYFLCRLILSVMCERMTSEIWTSNCCR